MEIKLFEIEIELKTIENWIHVIFKNLIVCYNRLFFLQRMTEIV